MISLVHQAPDLILFMRPKAPDAAAVAILSPFLCGKVSLVV
jgi:hypothetical protein